MDSNLSADELTKMLQSMVPQATLDFGRKILTDHGVPLPRTATTNALQLSAGPRRRDTSGRGGSAAPKVTLIANALGTPRPR
ncbi:hypothetical protein GS421_10415 [Rhodococcus hoagii]|nr:hypothetical protein [Prescottella equi]